MSRTRVAKMSKLYAPTLKEDPTDAEIASHKLLLRAGMIRKLTSGIYTWLPLGLQSGLWPLQLPAARMALDPKDRGYLPR